VAMSMVLSGRAPWQAITLLAAFGVVAGFTVWRARRFTRGRGQLDRFVESTLHTSGQFAVRLVLLVLSALVAVSTALQVDMLLGAFTAGIVWRTLIHDASPQTQDAVESKIEALAFGFLIPLFFITTGVSFDLQALLRQPWTLALVPLVTLALLIVRGLPASFAAPVGADRRDRLSVVLMGATGLPIIIVVTGNGVTQGYISPTTAAVLVGGGMLSVLLFPAVAGAVRARAQ
jgi:Kef-type K+ transport system membrane component KefB